VRIEYLIWSSLDLLQVVINVVIIDKILWQTFSNVFMSEKIIETRYNTRFCYRFKCILFIKNDQQ